MKKLRNFLLAGFLTQSIIASAYEVDTHERLTDNAVRVSALFLDSAALTDFGLEPLSNKQKFPNSQGIPQEIIDLFRFGANFEDNASLSRPRNHFYNPLNGQPLTVKGIALGNASPDWALEDTTNIGGQDFSLKDAREYLYKALTLPASADREKNFGLTFQTLGMVIHHIQDMAQPQHVRNDPHMDRLSLGGLNPLYNPSVYEKFTDRPVVRGSLPFTGYAPVYSTADTATFNNPRNFWTKTTGAGLAQFTNANFVSAGTNFDNPGMFNFPLFDPALRTDMDIQQLCANANPPCPNPNLTGTMAFFGNWVEDRYTGQRTLNPMASTLSIFDADLEKAQSKKLFTLNRFNFGVAHGFLIPRAVGYSAGLINYFFRGKIDFVPDPNNAGNYIIKNLGPETMSGDFTLYYDAVDGKRYPVAGDAPTETWTNRTIDANRQLANLSFTPPTNPAPKTDGEYMLVSKGSMGEEKAENGAVGAVIAKRIQGSGATDYVAMSMPNPVPYQGVSIGVAGGVPSAAVTDVFDYSGLGFTRTRTATLRNSIGGTVETIVGTEVFDNGTNTVVFSNFFWGYPIVYSGTPPAGWYTFSGRLDNHYPPVATGAFSVTSPSYESILAADQAAGTAKGTIIAASDGQTLGYMARDENGNPFAGTAVWNGGGYVEMISTDPSTGLTTSAGRTTFTVPEDCVYPLVGTSPRAPTGAPSTWASDWAAAAKVGVARRTAWFKKNSDEFVAALKTGFSPSAAGVSRAELKTGALPPAWEFQIKRDVDIEYGKYPRDQYNILVGKHTRRSVQFFEAAFSETVQSDTSAGLSQAGVMVTKREVTLKYDIPVVQPDGSTAIETRSVPVTGYLTQTVTQHNDKQGNWLDLSQKDEYVNWYNRENTPLPSGVPNSITSPYLQDVSPSRIGMVLNGTVQQGYNADSTLGAIDDPLVYATYVPAYPKASSSVTATAIPDFIATWHQDAKIEYLENGVGASDVLNDSALYGVKQVEITLVGLIADGNGTAPAGASLGIFSSGETGTQAEIYGTAVYNFDWQTGALTFNKWKPLHDAGGNEVASKVVNLPAGIAFPINNSIITYKGLHWPDVITAIAVRDQSLPTATSPSDKLLYELIKAIKTE
ncbi:MAG: phospholipase C/P1 nuclease family protein [Burkholderiales bacterium]